jgi:hypothetical protein
MELVMLYYYLTKAEHGNLATELVNDQPWTGEQNELIHACTEKVSLVDDFHD